MGSVSAVVTLEPVSVPAERADVIVPPSWGACDVEGVGAGPTYRGGGSVDIRELKRREGWREAACMLLKLPAMAESGGDLSTATS